MAIYQAAIVPKWPGEVPKHSARDLASTPIVQAPTKLTSVPRRMPKLGSRRPASANQSHIPEKQLQSHAQYPRPARQSPYGGVVAGGAQGYRAQPMGWLEASQRGHGTNLKPKHTQPNSGVAGLELWHLNCSRYRNAVLAAFYARPVDSHS